MNPNNKQPRVVVKCLCGNEFETIQKRLDEGRGKYCSKKCQYRYMPHPKKRKGSCKGNATSFKKGMVPWNKGKAGTYKNGEMPNRKGVRNSKGTEFKKGQPAWNKGIKWDEMTGDKHPNWRGDEVGYQGVHRWIKLILGYPRICNRCPETNAKRYEWHNISGEYKRDVTDWERLCTKCHRKEHRENGSLAKKKIR